MTISSYNDLIEFLELESTSLKNGIKVTDKALTVLCFSETKERLLSDVKDYIKLYGHLPLQDRPLFLGNPTEEKLKDHIGDEKYNKINEELEKKY